MKEMFIIFGLVVGIFIIRTFLLKLVDQSAERKSVDEKRRYYVSRAVDFLVFSLGLLLILTYSGLDFDDLGLFLGSIVTVLGVALFAQWSILSNMTASLMIFFFFPYRVGDEIQILDGENSVGGTIKEIALFHIILTTSDGLTATFPTALIFQKAVMVTQNSSTKPNKASNDEQS